MKALFALDQKDTLAGWHNAIFIHQHKPSLRTVATIACMDGDPKLALPNF